MRVLDLDMDYFMKSVATFINESEPERLPEEDYGDSVWSEREVRNFLEGNLGLSKQNRIRGRVVAGHNESLFFWRELIEKGDLSTPFDVIHVDSHADLGLGYSSWTHILDYLLYYMGSPQPASSSHPFVDVKKSAFYYTAMLWAVESGVTSGTSATLFSPNKVCNRGQVVTFLFRAVSE